ncbi:MAG: hypothetical protein JWQ27_2881 [Ferruginibacter sp.]|nr:hypothetical protein [Ferruginibacter sp.]
MKKLLFLLFAGISLAAAAQTKTIRDANAKPRTITGTFNAVAVETGVELFLTQGAETSLAVSMSDDKYADRYITEVKNGVLKIYFNSKGLSGNFRDRKLKAYLSVPALEKLTGASGSIVRTTNTLELTTIDMDFSSGAMFNGAINAKEMSVSQSSGSMVNLSGSAITLKIDLSSGSFFKGYDLQVDNCNAKASSGSGVKVTINKELTATASSGAGIQYKGSATVRDINVSSGGRVKRG